MAAELLRSKDIPVTELATAGNAQYLDILSSLFVSSLVCLH